MQQTTEFKTVDFFRAVRDKQAAQLAGKTSAEVVAFFSKFGASTPKPALGRSRQKMAHR